LTETVVHGAQALADAVRVTLGPKSQSVLVERKWGPLVCNDGVTIVKELVVNRIRGVLPCAAAKAPGYRDRRKEMLQDPRASTLPSSDRRRPASRFDVADLPHHAFHQASETSARFDHGPGAESFPHVRTIPTHRRALVPRLGSLGVIGLIGRRTRWHAACL